MSARKPVKQHCGLNDKKLEAIDHLDRVYRFRKTNNDVLTTF